ncbi:MAG: bifunctional folylpolyglutamate synthase/dihydrofolate synthase [Candidatus Poribacteria bacterium]|nr:MAG: bifunctional folylpolyglutamate synthase/dihydrofolate synthase [Candidatus Poribacteria bacterium]
MTYADARTYLSTFLNYERVPINAGLPRAFNLTRIRRLLEAMGNPQERFPAIHLAGTKGKGSTAVLLERTLREAGYRTGLYVQPHLLSPRERIVVGGRAIGRLQFVTLLERFLPLLERFRETEAGRLTYFEVFTALAFEEFARSGVQVAVVETGLGGRLDATNVLCPILSVITPIGYDHQQVLGETLPEIAAEKAGIIKPGVPVVCGLQPEPAYRVLREEAERRGAPWTDAGREVVAKRIGIVERRERAVLSLGERSYRVALKLLGAHQVGNAATALAAVAVLRRNGWTIPDAAVLRGFQDAWIAARVDCSRLDDGRPLVLDGAHTPESARALRSVLEELWPGYRFSFLVGMARDKDLQSFAAVLAPIAQEAIFTRTRVNPRAADPEALQEAWTARGVPTQTVARLDEGVRVATGPVVCVTGSVHFVGAALKQIAPWAKERWSHEIGLGTEEIA